MKYSNEYAFDVVLRAALQLYPNELGMLFQRDNVGVTVLDNTCSEFCPNFVITFFKNCVPGKRGWQQ